MIPYPHPASLTIGNCDGIGTVMYKMKSKILRQLTQPLVVMDTPVNNGGRAWFEPDTLAELLGIFCKLGEGNDTRRGSGIKMVMGNIEVGIALRFKRASYLIALPSSFTPCSMSSPRRATLLWGYAPITWSRPTPLDPPVTTPMITWIPWIHGRLGQRQGRHCL